MTPARRRELLAATPLGHWVASFGFDESKVRRDHGRFAPLTAAPAVGSEYDLPALGTRRALRVKFFPGDGPGTLGVGYHDYPAPHTFMPAASGKHFVNDMNGVVDAPPTSGNAAVDAALRGGGEVLGKGDDGLVLGVGDQVVKVSTTVPFQPFNPGHRSPQQAADMLAGQVAVNNAVRAAGVPGVLPVTLVRHGDKAFAVRDKLVMPERLTADQVAKVRHSLDTLHEAGYVVGDTIQVGLKGDEPYLFDLGKAGKSTHPDDRQDDSDRFQQFAREMLGVRVPPLAAHARYRLECLNESRGFMPPADEAEEDADIQAGLAASREAAALRSRP